MKPKKEPRVGQACSRPQITVGLCYRQVLPETNRLRTKIILLKDPQT